MQSSQPSVEMSIVVPVYNEEDNVLPMVAEVYAAMAQYPGSWELLVVDDGSHDQTDARLKQARTQHDERLRPVTLQRNFGQTAAMQAGIDEARGKYIATLDGDLQNDPADIPRLVKQLKDENLDLLQGWRKDRQDGLLLRKIPSRIANRLIARITGVHLHDNGCSLKIYRASVIKNVRLFGEMHRFIPAWMALQTSPKRIKEAVVNHRARQFGASKYGIGRTFRVIVDLLSVYFFMRFLARPGHFFGRIGLAIGGLGMVFITYLVFIKLFLGAEIGQRPLLLIGILFALIGAQFLTTGVLGELMARTYFSTGNRPYVIRRPDEDDAAGSGEH